MKKKKKILILGGEGFIGRNIADFLGGRYDCYSVGIEKAKFKNCKDKFIKKNPYKEKIKNSYDVIIHLIDNPVKIKEFSKEEEKLIKNLELNKSNHLIIFSSAAVYANPDSDYGKRKLELERIYSDCCLSKGIKLTVFRLFNVYGPYQAPNRQGSLVANILTNYLSGKTTKINDKSAKRDFLFSGDVGKFVYYAIKNSTVGTIDLASGRLISIGELMGMIEKDIIKSRLLLDWQGAKEKIFCPKAKNKLLGKVKITSLKNGLKKTFNNYK
jgi:nucleoside-diphosphate-sugar epimerase